MAYTKSYTTPVWWIGAIILLKLLYVIVLLIILKSYRNSWVKDGYVDKPRMFTSEIIFNTATIILLLAEAIVYWKIRSRIVRKQLVWVHLTGILLLYVAIPLTLPFITDNIPFANTFFRQDMVIQLRIASIGAFFIVAHICFVMVLIDAARKRKEKPELSLADSPDILNDYS